MQWHLYCNESPTRMLSMPTCGVHLLNSLIQLGTVDKGTTTRNGPLQGATDQQHARSSYTAGSLSHCAAVKPDLCCISLPAVNRNIGQQVQLRVCCNPG
jgi:hypothetical protein